ncbi:hypothetical protein JCM5353_004490 [Sporobolomyces roseus]
MLSSTLTLLALGAAGASAAALGAPVENITQMKRNIIKRNSLTQGADDATILSFALILEHLEDTFYSEALQKFDDAAFTQAGYPGVYSVLQQVAKDEHAHVEFLTAGLKAAGVTSPPQACTYDFGYTDVKSFLGLSQVVEGLGVSAYLGAAGDIEDASYLTAAGSILTVEARHNAFVRLVNSYQPAPQPFDTPLSASLVVGAATPFFKSCPEGSAPTIAAPPALALKSATYQIGGQIQVAPTNASAVNTEQTLYCGFASGLQSAFSEYKDGACTIPTENVTIGQTYLMLTTGPSLADASVVAGPSILDFSTANISVARSSSNSSSSGNGSSNSSTGSSKAADTNGASSIVAGAGFVSVLAGALSLIF